jgi:hypothetical protein
MIDKGGLVGLGATKVKQYHDWMGDWLWSSFLPAMKIYSAEVALEELVENFEMRGKYLDVDKAMRSLASTMDDAFGTQNFDKYIWSTPMMMQLLHTFIFAPDWTLSAFNISGAGNLPVLRDMIRENQSDIQKNLQLKKYWPGMVAIVMFGIPQVLQAIVYGAAKALPGDDDPDDTPFISLNEKGKSGIGGIGAHIDMTPLLRKFGWVPVVGYEGGKTGKRRVYLRFAKQATEVFEGWGTKPMQTLMNKTSATVRTAYEQITETNTGGWEMGYADEGMSGWLRGKDGSIADSRSISIIKKFVPMSLLSILEGRPSTFFAPASRGMTMYAAQLEYGKLLKVYGDQRTMNKVNSNQKYKTNLKALDNGILESAIKNGLDPDRVISGARRHVLSGYYTRFFKALNKDDYKELEKVAEHIKKINGVADNAVASMKYRYKNAQGELTAEKEAAVREAF